MLKELGIVLPPFCFTFGASLFKLRSPAGFFLLLPAGVFFMFLANEAYV